MKETKKRMISRYFFVYYNTKFISEVNSRKVALMLIACNFIFAFGSIFALNTTFINLLFPLGMFALPRFFEVQKRMKLQKNIGFKMLDLQTNPKDEKVNTTIINFAKQSKEDSFLMILLMYSSIFEIFVAKSIILKVVALLLTIVMLKVNYDKKCFRRDYSILKTIRVIDIMSFITITLISYLISLRLTTSIVNDIIICILCICSLVLGYLNRNKNLDNIFSTTAKKGFDTPNHNYKYVAEPTKTLTAKECEALETEKRKKEKGTIRITLDADARNRQSKKEKQVYKNYQLFLYNGKKNRELEKEAHKEWVSEQYMTDEEKREYHNSKKSKKDSGYVVVDNDKTSVDRFSSKGRR